MYNRSFISSEQRGLIRSLEEKEEKGKKEEIFLSPIMT